MKTYYICNHCGFEEEYDEDWGDELVCAFCRNGTLIRQEQKADEKGICYQCWICPDCHNDHQPPRCYKKEIKS